MDPSGLLSHPARLAGTPLLRLQSDERLVELARAGHEPAFDAIVHRYRPALLRYCTRILGPERAEDAVQQALASAHTAMTSGDDRQLNLRPWLYRIAHNTALNFLRGAKRDEVELSDEEFAAAHTPEDQVAERERLESVLAAIAALPRSQRDALLLRELEGRSHEEIGRALGVSSGAARATLFRARAAVRTACSALTPTPLLLRLVEVGDSSSHVAAKAVAGVLAGCAIVGGGAATSGVLGGTHHPARPSATQEVGAAHKSRSHAAPAPSAAATTAAAAAPVTAPDPAPAAVASLRAVKPPKPAKVPKHPAPPRPRHRPGPKPPGPAAVLPAPAQEHHDRGRHEGRDHRGPERPETAAPQGRGPAHDDASRGHGRGRGHDDAAAAAPPVAPPASAPAEHARGHGPGGDDGSRGNGRGHGRGHDDAGMTDEPSSHGGGPGPSDHARGPDPTE
jgi:RNA polymerase sigma factor (sigma-70 family)